MKTQLVVDAACDLPPSFIEQRNITVLPVKIDINGETIIDRRDPKLMADFYRQDRLSIKNDVKSHAFSVEEINEFFKNKVVPDCRYALMQTTSSKRSQNFERCQQAMPQIRANARAAREKEDVETPFGMRVMNSQVMFCGQGALAAFTSDLIAAGRNTKDVLRLSDAFRAKIIAIAVPADIIYIRERARRRGETSISMVSSLLAKTLDIKPIVSFARDETQVVAKERGFKSAVERLFEYTKRRIKKGLLMPYVVVGYGGDPAEIT